MMYDDLAEAFGTDTQTRFPVLREVLREDLAHYADHELIGVAQQIMPGVDLDALEFSLRDLGRSIGPAMSQVGQVMGRAAPGALSGALSGATAGAALGPYGMLAGAAIGAIGGGISSYNASRPQSGGQPRQPQTRPAQVAVTPRPTTRPAPRPAQRPAPRPAPLRARPAAPRSPAQPQTMHPAIGQMLQLLSRPEVIQAILAASAGALGRPTTQIAGETVATQTVLDVVRMPVVDGDPSDNWEAAEAKHHVIELLERADADTHPLWSALEVEHHDYVDDWTADADPNAYSPQY